MNKNFLLTLGLITYVFSTVTSASLFDIKITANRQVASFNFEDAQESIESFDATSLEDKFSDFDSQNGATEAILNFRGLNMNLKYGLNSNILQLSIPSIRINESFTGATRDESNKLLVDFLKKDGGKIVNQIARELAKVSSSDPIAGNPSSLMSTQVSNIHDDADSAPSSGSASSTSNTFDFRVRLGKYNLDGVDTQAFHFPLAYTFNLDNKPGHKIKIKVPVSYAKINDSAESFGLGLGIAYTYPLNDQLLITPGLTYGAVGSTGLGSVAALQTLSLTTKYAFNFVENNFLYSNTIASVKTLSLDYKDYSTNPDLSNTILVNGITWRSVPTKNFKSVEIFFEDTRFFGDELFSERTNEIGATFLATADSIGLTDTSFRIGASYVFTDKSDLNGFKLNFSSKF